MRVQKHLKPKSSSGPVVPQRPVEVAVCGAKEGGEAECLRAAPFADWNEWYGAAVTIHACSFTSLSLPLYLSLLHSLFPI